MNNAEYIKNLDRLKEIETLVRNPESSLDKIEGLLEETKKIVTACLEYTRGLKSQVDSLQELENN